VANHTIESVAVFIPEIWANEIQKFAEKQLVLASRVKRFDSLVKGKGDVIHVPKVTEASTTIKQRSVDVVATAGTETEFTLTVDKHYYVSRIIEDMAKIQASQDLMSIYTQADGYSIAKQIDTSLGALISGLSQITGAFGSAITDATIVASIVKLDEANAPESDRHFAIRPASKGDMLKLDKFVLQYAVGADRVNTGRIGEVYGVEVVTSTNLPWTDASPDQASNVMFHRDCLALAMQQSPRVQSQYKIEKLGDQMVVDAIYGVAEYRDTFGVWVKS
jgi:hypothetical protein